MKTKLYYLLCLFIVVPLVLASCKDDVESVEATLEVSMNPVNFAKAGGEQKVTITTNQEKWVASSPLEASWLTLSQSGTELTVKAEANTGDTDRKGFILVNAGGAAAKISVMQSAGDVYLNLSTEKADFLRKGGELRIDVVSNGTFKVEMEETAKEWLKVDFMEGTNYFKISVQGNATADARMAKIYVIAGKITKEVAVSQEGQELILLPFFAKEPTISKIVPFEQERGSIMIKTPDGMFNQDQYHFATTNADFPLVIYQCPDAFSKYSQAVTATPKGDLCKGEKFENYLKAKGFEKKAEGMYMHKEIPYSLAVALKEGQAILTATYVPNQDKPYPTFTELPLKQQMAWTALYEQGKHGSKYEVAAAWEKEKGAVLDTTVSKLPDFAWYNIHNSKDHTLARAYWMYTATSGDKAPEEYYNEINAVRAIFDKVDLVFWQEGKMLYMTREFEKLLADNKFVFVGNSSEGYRFYTDGANTLAFKIARFKDFMDGAPVLDFQTFKQVGKESAVSILTNMDKRIEYFKEIKARMRKMENMRSPL